MSSIYAFRDIRYEIGIKIGWDKNDTDRIKIAQSYTPAEIVFEAAWEINGSETYREYERRACNGLNELVFLNNGSEWYDVDIHSCISQVTKNLGIEPKLKPCWHNKSNWDDFRSPRGLNSTRMHKYKQVLWAYEENSTKRIKVQRIDDWKTPREVRKTYSRNGFRPIAAVTYKGEVTYENNVLIHKTWEKVLSQFGTPTDNSTFGWLPVGVQGDSLIDFFKESKLEFIDSPFKAMPTGVKPSYN